MSIDFPNIDKKMAVFSALSMDTTYDIGWFYGRVHAVFSMAYEYGRNMAEIWMKYGKPLPFIDNAIDEGQINGVAFPTTPKKILVQLLFFLAL